MSWTLPSDTLRSSPCFCSAALAGGTLGSIETGNHGDLAVLDRDCFSVSEEDFKRTRSLLTVVGGKVVHNDGVM